MPTTRRHGWRRRRRVVISIAIALRARLRDDRELRGLVNRRDDVTGLQFRSDSDQSNRAQNARITQRSANKQDCNQPNKALAGE